MKAEEPGSRERAEKYGMPIEQAPNIVRRHFEVLDEEAALVGAQIAHDIEVSKALCAAKAGLTVPIAPAVVQPPPSVIAVVSPQPQDLRARLGLS